MPSPPPIEDDFDAWYAETHQPYRFKLLGKTWELPATLPAVEVIRLRTVLRDALASDDDTATVTDADGAEVSPDKLLRSMAGDQIVDQWIELGLTEEHQMRVVRVLLARYVMTGRHRDPELDHDEPDENGGEDEGKAPEPASSSTGSSSTGTRSSRTGTPSTAETSPTT